MRIPMNDLKITNVGDKGVQIVHIPTDRLVASQNKKNYEQNFTVALKKLHKQMFPQDFLKRPAKRGE